MNLELAIRNLAKSAYWQNLYMASKDTGSIHLFNNVNNFSGAQNLFLYWLRVYAMLYDDLSSKECKFLTQNVIDDVIRCDAYLYYKRKKYERDLRKYQTNKSMSDMGVKDAKNTSLFDVEIRSS